MNKIKLVIFGLERNPFNDELFNELQDSYFDVTVLYTISQAKTENNTRWKVFKQERYDCSYAGRVKLFFVLRSILKSPTSVFVFTGYSSISFLFGMIACILFRRKYLVFSDVPVLGVKKGLFVDLARAVARWLAFQKSSGVLTTGSPGREAFILLGCDPKKIVNYPYTPRVLSETDAYSEFGDASHNPEAIPRILVSGQLIHRKGVDLVLFALSKLKEQGIFVECIVEGEGSMRDFLGDLSNRLGLTEQVQFPGFNSPEGHSKLLRSVDIVIAPSRWEPWGNIVPEAMSVGKVVIASSAVASARDRVVHGVNGLIFEVDNPMQLVDCLSQVLNDRDFSDRLSRAAGNSAGIWRAELNALMLASFLN